MSLALPALLLLSCTGSGSDTGAGVFDLQITMSEVVPTVATVRFDLPEATSATVVFGRDGAFDEQRSLDLSEDSHVVLGMKPGSTYDLRVDAQTADGTVQSRPVTVETGQLPNDLPQLTLDEPAGADQHSSGYLVTSFIQPATGLIIDRDGDIVWWYSPESAAQLGRTRISPDGKRIWLADVNLEGREEASLVSVALDGTDEQSIEIDWRHHDFILHEDGTTTVLAHDPRVIDDETYWGDRIIEVAPDGTQTEIYNVFDHHEAGAGRASTPGPGGESNWPHANYLEWIPEQDTYLISFRELEGIAAVDRSTGDERWMLGGEDGTLTTADSPNEFIGGQHGVEWLGDDRLLIFANGLSDNARAVEYQLALAQDRAEPVWTYEPGLTTPAMGDVRRLDSGNTLVTFSYNGEYHEVTPDGELVWILSASLGGATGFTEWYETLPPWN